MSNKTNQKSFNKRTLVGLLVLTGVLIFLALTYKNFRVPTSEGDKTVTIEVVDDAGKTTSYEVQTDAEYLRQVMDEADGLSYEGTEGDYGLMVESVNGLRAIYDKDGAYWAFYQDGEYCNYSIDEQPVKDGDNYSIEYTLAE